MASTLERVAELKRLARSDGAADRWEAALEGYEEACALLEGPGEAEGETTRGASSPAAKELQSCRLNGAVCCLQLQQWSDAIRLCGAVLRANPRCATAHHR